MNKKQQQKKVLKVHLIHQILLGNQLSYHHPRRRASRTALLYYWLAANQPSSAKGWLAEGSISVDSRRCGANDTLFAAMTVSEKQHILFFITLSHTIKTYLIYWTLIHAEYTKYKQKKYTVYKNTTILWLWMWEHHWRPQQLTAEDYQLGSSRLMAGCPTCSFPHSENTSVWLFSNRMCANNSQF